METTSRTMKSWTLWQPHQIQVDGQTAAFLPAANPFSGQVFHS